MSLLNKSIQNILQQDDHENTNQGNSGGNDVQSCAYDIFSRQIFLRYPTIQSLTQIDDKAIQVLQHVANEAAPGLCRMVGQSQQGQQGQQDNKQRRFA